MDKFSKMSGQKVNEEPELVTNKDKIKLEALKAGITKLIDNYLTIRYYGSGRKNLLESTAKIGGKELFIEALIDFMNEKSIDDQIKVLESLKGDTRDWQVIDNKISKLQMSIIEQNQFNNNKTQISKIKTLLDTYSGDDRFETILENMVAKSPNSEEASVMSVTANKMKSNFKFLNYSSKHLALISEKYAKKAQELKFKEDVYANR